MSSKTVAKHKKIPRTCSEEFFYPIRRIGMASTRPTRCMESRRSRAWHRAKRVLNLVLLRIDVIHHFVMIPFAPSSRFHTATSCGFHTCFRRDLMRILPQFPEKALESLRFYDMPISQYQKHSFEIIQVFRRRHAHGFFKLRRKIFVIAIP